MNPEDAQRAATTTAEQLAEAKRQRRAEVEKIKNDFWADLVTQFGGTVPPDARKVFAEYSDSLEKVLEAMFAEMDLMQQHYDSTTKAMADAATAIVNGDLDAARKAMQRWSEENFLLTGVAAGIRHTI